MNANNEQNNQKDVLSELISLQSKMKTKIESRLKLGDQINDQVISLSDLNNFIMCYIDVLDRIYSYQKIDNADV